MLRFTALLVTSGLASLGCTLADQPFSRPPSSSISIESFSSLRDRLPAPRYDREPLWVQMYWKAWELACRNFYEPASTSGFVSPFIDAAFNQNIFFWDSCFMSLFCNIGYPLVPGICSLDNFYSKQHADGEICREIHRTRGTDFQPWVNSEGRPLFSRWSWTGSPQGPAAAVHYRGKSAPEPAPDLTLDALNHPIAAWAEWESYLYTGDRDRLAAVYTPLLRYYQALQKYLQQGNGLYVTDWASMDNSPRNRYLHEGGCGVDISSEMVLFARNLADIAIVLGKKQAAQDFMTQAAQTSALINQLMWNPQTRFYHDLTLTGERVPVKTIAGFWPLLAHVAAPSQARDLVHALEDRHLFKRCHSVPTLAADDSAFCVSGGYWRGAVWAPTNAMIIRGLEAYGETTSARRLAWQHIDAMAQVFRETGTIWENYAADAIAPGRFADGRLVKKDFVGWSGLGPILFFIEYVLGLKPNAATGVLQWNLAGDETVGCDRYRFGGRVISLLAEPKEQSILLTVDSTAPFVLQLTTRKGERKFSVQTGYQQFTFKAD